MRLPSSFALLRRSASLAATTFTLTTTDRGAGCLRAAIQSLDANTAENSHAITYSVASGPTNEVLSNLQAIGRRGALVSIDGSGLNQAARDGGLIAGSAREGGAIRLDPCG